jgi:hypothetical protein
MHTMKGICAYFARGAISQVRLVPFSSVHNSQANSPSEFQDRGSWLDRCLNCRQIAPLNFTKPAILKKIALKVD